MLRILFVCLAPPFPPTNGQRLRNWGLLRAMADEGHEVTLLSFADADGDYSQRRHISSVCRTVRLVPMPRAAEKGAAEYRKRLCGLLTRLPYGVLRLRSDAMAAEIRSCLAQEQFDALLCDDIYAWANLPHSAPVPVILNKHDITHVILRRYLKFQRNPLQLAYGWSEYWKLRRWETLTCERADLVITCSEVDRRVLQSLSPATRFAIVPNVIDTAEYAPQFEDDGHTVLYVGSMDWYPNTDAVTFFVFRILPELRRLAPNARFVVAGRNPSPKLLARCSAIAGIEFTGALTDVRPLLAKTAVCVVPLRIGSGTRLKILEAAAMGKPVVSTTVGAEGLAFVDGQEILLADEPQAFAAAVARLLRDTLFRRVLGDAARRRVEQRYGLNALRSALRIAFGALESTTQRGACGVEVQQ